VTTLNGHLVRPHDLEIETGPFDGASAGRIERFTRVGFEVRLGIRLSDDDAAPPALVTLTRAEATAKGLTEDVPVWIKPVAGASQVRITASEAAAPDPVESASAGLSPEDAREPTFS
jgi:sulfate/thiosulfate transport system ATP-binding protein